MNQERRIRNQICTKGVIGTSEFKLGSENFLRKNDTTIATTMPTRSRSSITMCTFDTNNSTGTIDSAHPSHNDESFADSDALSFLRMQQRRSSLSTINIALSILTVDDDDELQEENIEKKLTIALDNETPSKTLRRGAVILDEIVLKELAIAMGDCDETPAKPFRRTTNDGMEALDENVLKELAIALGDCDEAPAKPFRRTTNDGMEILDENVLKELAITLSDCDEAPAKPFRRPTNNGMEELDESILKELAIAVDNETPSKPFRRGAEILDENVLKELAITLGDETPAKPFRRTTNNGMEALDENVLKELAIAVDNETPSKPYRRGAEILDENVLKELAITLGDETPAKPFRRTTNNGMKVLDENVLKELAIAVDNETPSKPFRRGAEILDENILEAPEKPFKRISMPDGIEVLDESIEKELAIALDDQAPEKPFRRISMPDGIEIPVESIQKELAIVLDDEVPEKAFRRISTPDGIEVLDESIQKELAIVLDDEVPEIPYIRISTPDGIEIPVESIKKELAIVLDDEVPEKPFRRISTPDGIEVLDESIQKELAKVLDNETPEKPFRRKPFRCLSPARKIQVKWPSISVASSTANTKALSNKAISSLSTFSSVPLDEENLHEQLEHITDISHYAENSLTDLEESLDSSKSIKHNEIGFGRPDVWVRPTDTYEESSKRRKSECDKRHHHNERGFCRPDEWVTPNTSYDGSLECRSSRSPVTSRTAKDRSARQSSPDEHSTHSRKKTGLPKPLTCAVTLDEYKNLEGLMETHSIVKDLMEACNVRVDCADGIEEYRRKKYQKKKKIMKGKSRKARDKSSSQVTISSTYRTIKDDSDDGYKRGTPTLEKIALQQAEEESNIKLWWEF